MRHPVTIPSEGDQHGIVSPLLLLCSSLWTGAMAIGISQAEDTSRFSALFGCLAVANLLIAFAAWLLNPTWDDWGRIGIWFVFGLTLSLWMIGIFSIGWLLFPALIMNVIALIAWPRQFDRPIATREGVLAEIVGFLSGPVIVAVTLSVFGY